ncbi:hypothetical protein O0544_01755 [Edwardsiella anguillarum]|nr:hypothetical protein [Edwardsiella anguillarum]
MLAGTMAYESMGLKTLASPLAVKISGTRKSIPTGAQKRVAGAERQRR